MTETTAPVVYKLDTVKLIGHDKLTDYIQDYVTDKVDSYMPQFAHVIVDEENNTLKMQSAFWTCKDYTVDCFNNDVCNSVHYSKATDGPIYEKECRILLLLNHKNHVGNFLHNIKHLHHYEKQARFKRTEVHDTDEPQIKYIQASGMWMKNSFMLSTFLSLVRLCVTPKKETPDFAAIYTQPNLAVNEARWLNYMVEVYKPIYNKNFQLILDNLRKFAVKSTTISPAGTHIRTNGHGLVGIYSFLNSYGLNNVYKESIHKELESVLTKISGERYIKAPPKKEVW